ncbi:MULTISPECIES: MBL fold metallo-hydrolase [Prescottella]|uniref:MBL fold metallo-hydrolase n=1 Tax=Prescottella TaxID=2979332 RepID=UPI0020C64610|nr:MBL fold metallo-hydrolase [Prescottella equi]
MLLRDGDALTLIDGGYPGDVAAVDGAIRSLERRPEDVQGTLLTHAHVDHMGAIVSFHERYGIPVFTDPTEVAHADGTTSSRPPVRTSSRCCTGMACCRGCCASPAPAPPGRCQ